MNLSIVIVSWNTADLLAQCLESIYLHPPHNQFEVLVVDNASTDASISIVRRKFPQVKLLKNEINVGFAQANNQAIRNSAGSYVLLLNPDTEVKPNALETLVKCMESHLEAGAIGPHTLNPNGSLQTSCYPAPTLPREFWRLLHLDMILPYGSYRMADWDLTRIRAVEGLQGSCLLLRRTALDQVGLLDERYFIYSEEVDLCYRLQRAGWKLYWVPQAQIVHYGGKSTQQVAENMFLQLYRGKLTYFRKHHGWPAAQTYKLILLVAALIRILLSPIAWLEPPSRRHRHLILARNYGKLVRALPGM